MGESPSDNSLQGGRLLLSALGAVGRGGSQWAGMWGEDGRELPKNLLFHKPGHRLGSGAPGPAWGCR